MLSQLQPEVDALKLISMCLVHDLAEARTGDLNTVHKTYVTADEAKALEDTTRPLPFGSSITGLIKEYNKNHSIEAQLAHDADQLALVLELQGGHLIRQQQPQPAVHVVQRFQRLAQLGRPSPAGLQVASSPRPRSRASTGPCRYFRCTADALTERQTNVGPNLTPRVSYSLTCARRKSRFISAMWP